MTYRNITLGGSIARGCSGPMLGNGTVPVWVSWINGSIIIGRGNVTGLNPMLYYPDNSLLANVSTVAVSSYGVTTVVWKIPYNQNAGNTTKINDQSRKAHAQGHLRNKAYTVFYVILQIQ